MRRDYVTNVVETRDTSPAVQRCRNAREARHRCIALPVIDGRYLVNGRMVLTIGYGNVFYRRYYGMFALKAALAETAY